MIWRVVVLTLLAVIILNGLADLIVALHRRRKR